MHEEEKAGLKRSAFVAVGADSVVELAQPLSSTSPEARDMEQNGEGVYSLMFKTRDLPKANDFLKSKGCDPRRRARIRSRWARTRLSAWSWASRSARCRMILDSAQVRRANR